MLNLEKRKSDNNNDNNNNNNNNFFKKMKPNSICQSCIIRLLFPSV